MIYTDQVWPVEFVFPQCLAKNTPDQYEGNTWGLNKNFLGTIQTKQKLKHEISKCNRFEKSEYELTLELSELEAFADNILTVS